MFAPIGQDMPYWVIVGNNPVNFVDPLGLDVTVTLYPGAGGFGHVGVGVNTTNTRGFYPDPDSSPLRTTTGQDVNGTTLPDTRAPIDSITITTTSDQDSAIQKAIENRTQNPGTYNLFSRNCAGFVNDVLDAGGIHCPDTILPRELMDDLKKGRCK